MLVTIGLQNVAKVIVPAPFVLLIVGGVRSVRYIFVIIVDAHVATSAIMSTHPAFSDHVNTLTQRASSSVKQISWLLQQLQ